MGLFDIAVGPVGSFLVDQIMGDGTNEAIDHYVEGPGDAWSNAREDRKKNDPNNTDLDAAAAEHYLFTRKEAMAAGEEYGPLGAVAGALGSTALTMGYDQVKSAGFLVKDFVSDDAGDFLLNELVQATTDDIPDGTLPSRPTIGSTLAGIKGGIDGAGESLWNYFAE
jgi:hypothetical protein